MAITGLHKALSLAIQPVKRSCSLPEGWIRDFEVEGVFRIHSPAMLAYAKFR